MKQDIELHNVPGINLRPIVSYPDVAQAGASYLLSIDIELADLNAPWPYPQEEYELTFVLDLHPYFSYQPTSKHEPAIILHRFGGTYGPAEYLITANEKEVEKGNINITFINGFGIPIASLDLPCEIRPDVPAVSERDITVEQREPVPIREREPAFAYAESIQPGVTLDKDEGKEKTSRELIAEQLMQTGWLVIEWPLPIDLTDPPIEREVLGFAIYGYPEFGEDYLLTVNSGRDNEPVGIVKVHQIGETLSGIQDTATLSEQWLQIMQFGHYRKRASRRIPFAYDSTGYETQFTNYREPDASSRTVFTFHRPETLARWLEQAPANVPVSQNDLLRSRLRRMPPLQQEGLYDYQFEAIKAIEQSLAENHSHTLIRMETGTGKTYTAIHTIYRLLRYGSARRILYIVDTDAAGQYALDVFEQYIIDEENTKFTDFYTVSITSTTSNRALDPVASVHIVTIADAYVAYVGGFQDPINRLGTTIDGLLTGNLVVSYNLDIPIEHFDVILLAESEHLDYQRWRPFLEYFDTFFVGIADEVSDTTLNFFNHNLVNDAEERENISTQTRIIVQRLWNYCNILRDDGLSYGDYMEQLTYLLFLKMANERTKAPYNEESRIPADCDWLSLISERSVKLETQYLHILTTLGKQQDMLGTMFHKAQNKIQDPVKLRQLVDLIDGADWVGMDTDAQGDAYEWLLEKNAEDTKGSTGQYFTPRALIPAIVDVMQPQPDQKICDPACGTGGFLLVAHDYIINQNRYSLTREQAERLKKDTFYGWEILDNIARLCIMNLFLHGIGDETQGSPITVKDSLISKPERLFDMVLSNPPFGRKSSLSFVRQDEKVDDDVVQRDDFWASTSNQQLNFVQHITSLLKPYGRAAVVVPDNVLFEGGAGEQIRENLLKKCRVHTLLRLPTGIFYTRGVKANVLFFDRMPPAAEPWTEELWIYDFRTNQNFTLRTNPLKREHLHDFVRCYDADNKRSKRQESNRFRRFSYADLVKRDKLNLDIFWLRDEDPKDSENEPPPFPS